MIYNDKQYSISRGKLDKLKNALAATEALPKDNEWIQGLEINGLKSQITEIEADLSYYDGLKAGEIVPSESISLETLPSVLIQARIASGLSQADLAEKIGLELQQIQRYEASEYIDASLSRLIEVSRVLDVHAENLFETNAVFTWSAVDEVVWNKLPVNEMARRRWFDVPRGTDIIERAKEYFQEDAGLQFVAALQRKKMRGVTISNEYSLLAWQTRVHELAMRRIEGEQLPAFKFDERWLDDLPKLTRRQHGPRSAIQLLAENGIVLVTEKHLPGMYLDGATMLAASGHPIIGLTLRHDRLDNFWFTLFHELGHVYLHLFDGLRYDYFDDNESSATDSVELEANKFALNRLIPEQSWDQCLSRFSLSEEAIQLDSDRLGIDASIIAGRIRRELGNYNILTRLVSDRQVGDQILEVTGDLDR